MGRLLKWCGQGMVLWCGSVGMECVGVARQEWTTGDLWWRKGGGEVHYAVLVRLYLLPLEW